MNTVSHSPSYHKLEVNKFVTLDSMVYYVFI